MSTSGSNPAQAESQRRATRAWSAVRGTFSPARAWRLGVIERLSRTVEVDTHECTKSRGRGNQGVYPGKELHAVDGVL